MDRQQQWQNIKNFSLATYMNSLFRTGVPPASHLTKTQWLTQHKTWLIMSSYPVNVHCIAARGVESPWLFSWDACYCKLTQQPFIVHVSRAWLSSCMWWQKNLTLIFTTQTLDSDTSFRRGTRVWHSALLKRETDGFSSLTLALLGQTERLRGDHRCSCCRPQCRRQRRCNNSLRPRSQIYTPPLCWSYRKILDQPSACKPQKTTNTLINEKQHWYFRKYILKNV